MSQILFNNFCVVSLKKKKTHPTAKNQLFKETPDFISFLLLTDHAIYFQRVHQFVVFFFSNVPSGILQFAAGEVTGSSTLVRALSLWQERLFLLSYCIAQLLYFLFPWAGLRLEVLLSQLLEFGGHRTIPPCLPSPFLATDDVFIEWQLMCWLDGEEQCSSCYSRIAHLLTAQFGSFRTNAKMGNPMRIPCFNQPMD